MNNIHEDLFEIRIIGKDFTPIYKCLGESYIEFKNEDYVVDPTLFDDLRDELYFRNYKKNKKIYKPSFLGFDEVNEKIVKELSAGKKNQIIIRIDEEIEAVQQKIAECKNALKGKDPAEKAKIQNTLDSLKSKKKKITNIKKITQNNFQLSDAEEKEVIIPSREDLLVVCKDEEEINQITSFFIYENERSDIWSKAFLSRVNTFPLAQLLKYFSDDIDFVENEDIIVGRRKDRDKDLTVKDCTLYDFYNKPMFGSLVGTVRKQYSCVRFVSVFSNCLSKELKKQIASYGERKISITVQIRSRFDSDPNKPFFLLEMLTKGNIRFNSNTFFNSNEDVALYDYLLISILRDHLLKAYQKGVFRSYQSFRDNGMKLKGNIDFAQHIKENMNMSNGKIAYAYREKSVDNYLNHLILESYEHLKRKYYDVVVQNFDMVSEVREVIELLRRETGYPKYKRGSLLKKCENPIIHPYYTEYEDLRKVCLNILRGEGVSIMSGSNDEISGLLYYVPDLWEEYLESKLINMGVSSQEVIYVLSGNNGFANEFRPDYVFRDEDDNPYMILDAKYKPEWIKVHRTGKFGRYKEDYSECVRNMNAINAYATGVIFPYRVKDDKKDIEPINMHYVSEYNGITSFYTIPICIPQPKSRIKKNAFSIWQKSLQVMIEDKVICLRKLIKCERKKKLLLDEAINSVDLTKYSIKQKNASNVIS